MEKRWWGKLVLLVGAILFAAMHVYPTVAKIDLEETSFPIKQKINLGLDLQGGLYMVLGVDFIQVFQEVVDNQASNLRGRLKDKEIGIKKVSVKRQGFAEDDPRISLEYSPKDKDAIYKIVKEEFWILRFTADEPGRYEFGLSHEYRGDVRERTIDQSIEVIRNRIDEFGVSEPTIASQGNDRIIVELPGVKDIQRAKKLIGDTAKLEFRMVNDEQSRALPSGVAGVVAQVEKEGNLSYKEGEKFSAYLKKLNELAAGKIPEDSEIAFERVRGPTGQTISRAPYLLFKQINVTGDDLQDAQVQFDPETRAPEVGFTFGPRGASIFEKLTGENIGKRLAIVLDHNVITAPVIQSRIGAQGRITMGRSGQQDVLKEAKDLAIQLRAGALPAQLEFMEERVVGPTLGQDSIRLGGKAAAVGALLVFIFILIYYRASGAIAVFSLVLNVLFVFAVLIGLEATLTLPGIAGIALTIGIAVDSNVVIYERIREEIRAGKQLLGAVESGFQKAFRTILDANITNASAAIVLMTYGTGPIKGFAVTMLIGIIATLFTAVFVCRLIFDFYLRRLETRTNPSLSI